MRTLLAGEFAIATAGDTSVDIDVKLEVQNGSGTWINVATGYGARCVIQAQWGEQVDTPVSTATFTIVQKIGSLSGAPLISASLLNRLDDGVTYSPLFNPGRGVRMSTATTLKGVAPTTEYRQMFIGRIDTVDLADQIDVTAGPITLACSDLGAWLMDHQIEAPGTQYGNPSVPPALETVIQSVITDNTTVGEPAVTLVKESGSSFGVTDFGLGDGKLLDLLVSLVLDSTGEDLRYRYDASHVSQLMWFDPNRTRVTVDQTFAANTYLLRKLDQEIANIRNAGTMPYATGYVTVTDATSIALYRRRWFRLDSSSMITTSGQATTVLTAMINDLSEPPGLADAVCPYLWFVQLYDRYTFTQNARQFDNDQTFGVTGFQHTIVNGLGSTVLTCGGRILGAYAKWLLRLAGTESGFTDNPPQPNISLKSQTQIQATLTFDCATDPGESPVSWRYRLLGDVAQSTAWSSPVVGGLPITAVVQRAGFSQLSIELEATQQDGQIATVRYNVQGQILGVVSGTSGKRFDGEMVGGIGGVPVSGARIHAVPQYDSQGANVLVDPVLGRFTASLSGPTGITATVIEDGGNKGHGGFTNTTGALVSTAVDSRAAALNNMFRSSVDDTTSVVDGTGSPLSGGKRGFSTIDSSNRVKRANGFDDGDFGARATNNTGFALHASVIDSRASSINNSFRISTDTTDSVVDGTGSPISGGKRGQSALNSSFLLISGVHASAVGSDGYGNIESRRTAARQSGHATGLGLDSMIRIQMGGVPVSGSGFSSMPHYDSTGALLIIDPFNVPALTSLRTLGSQKKRVRMHKSSAQSVASATFTTLTFDTEDFDVGSIGTTASGKITIPSDNAGLWILHAAVVWGASNAGFRSLWIEDSSGNVLTEDDKLPVSALITTGQHCWIMVNDPAAGAWFVARGQQTSGGALNAINGQTFFEAFHLW